MSAQSFRADGTRLEKTINLTLGAGWSAKLGLAASYLHGTEGDEQSFGGQVAATSSDYAVGAATWVRTQTDIDHNTFKPLRGSRHPPAAMASRPMRSLSWPIRVAIPSPRRRWTPSAGSTGARCRTPCGPLLNTTIAYNANLDRDAFINGIDSRTSFVEHIPTKLRLAASLPVVSEWSADLEDDEVKAFISHRSGRALETQGAAPLLHYDVRTGAVELGAHLSWLAVSPRHQQLSCRSRLGAGDVNPTVAHLVGAHLLLRIPHIPDASSSRGGFDISRSVPPSTVML